MSPDEADRLAEANLWRCRRLAHEMTRTRPAERDEAQSVANGALAVAIRAYDPARDAGGGFGPFAHRSIANAVSNHLHASRPKGYRRRRRVAGPAPPAVVQEDRDAMDARPGGEPPVGWALDWEDFVTALAGRLPGRRGEVIRLRYLHADAQAPAALAARMGVDDSLVRRFHREAIAMLRARFAG